MQRGLILPRQALDSSQIAARLNALSYWLGGRPILPCMQTRATNGCETDLSFLTICIKNEDFTKTGSGQTWGSHSKKGLVSQSCLMLVPSLSWQSIAIHSHSNKTLTHKTERNCARSGLRRLRSRWYLISMRLGKQTHTHTSG